MEREFHSWLKSAQSQWAHDTRVELGIGDDAAIIKAVSFGDSGIVVSTDTIAAGTHFQIAEHSLQRIGRKSVAVNLSDIAAMGATPVAAVLTFMLPTEFTVEEATQLFQGCHEIANEYNMALVGGDTNRWNGSLVVGATVIGREPDKGSSWKISGAQVGDAIVVSGKFGGSIFGNHLDFTPRIELATYLNRSGGNHRDAIHAATDVTDSLTLDLAAIASASGDLNRPIGVEIEANKIPIATAAHELAAQTGSTALHHALTDGEDFELVFAIDAEKVEMILNDPDLPVPLTKIGRFVTQDSFTLITNGAGKPFQPTGYSH